MADLPLRRAPRSGGRPLTRRAFRRAMQPPGALRLGVLRRPGFRRLWAGQAVTQFGSQVSLLALPLTALTALHADPFAVTAVQAAQVAPYLVVGLSAGAWVDRLPLRPMLVTTDLLRAVALATVPLAAALRLLTLWQLYAVGLVLGTASVFFDVAYQAFLPELLPEAELTEGNGRLELARSAARVLGPALGGGLVAAFGGPTAVSVDAASFLYSAVMIRRIAAGATRQPQDTPTAAVREVCARTRRQIAEGLRYVRRHRELAPITATSTLLNFAFAMTSALVLTFASRTLRLPPARIGLVTALAGAGFVAGALVARRAGRRLGTGPALIRAALLTGGGPLLIPLAVRTAPTALLVGGLMLQGFGVVVFNVNQVSLRQSTTPRELLGRVNATMRFVVWGALPVGALLAGALADTVGLTAAMWTAALVGLPACLPLVLANARRKPPAPEPSAARRESAGTTLVADQRPTS